MLARDRVTDCVTSASNLPIVGKLACWKEFIQQVPRFTILTKNPQLFYQFFLHSAVLTVTIVEQRRVYSIYYNSTLILPYRGERGEGC
jgi:hypothetical protein